MITFSDILASSIHDLKNALSLITNSIEELISDPALGLSGNPRVARLQLESQRANNNLVQLLALYKHENNKLMPLVDEYNLEDFIEDIAIENRALALAQGIDIETRCDPLMSAYFDENLLRGVINSAVGNAQRYTKDRILISAEEQDGFSVIRVEDNGDGFPKQMLELQTAESHAEDFNQGRTQLGIYFANLVAGLHLNKGTNGFIRLENRINLDGGCFSVWLP